MAKVNKSSDKPNKSTQQPLLLPAFAASTKLRYQPTQVDARKLFVIFFSVFAMIFFLGLIIDISWLAKPNHALSEETQYQGKLGRQFKVLNQDVAEFENAQAAAGIQIIDSNSLEQELSAIQLDLQVAKKKRAADRIAKLEQTISAKQQQLNMEIKAGHASPANVPVGWQVPILIYHKTPPDFENQLNSLQQKGYTAITIDAFVAALHHTAILPSKPVIISFDDGFSNQLAAFELLQKRRIPAVFYIISGGDRSHWCIGAGRRYGYSGQPPEGCGDAYMNWGEIRKLDRSGLITIGAHTVDHENLASLPPELQRFEINQNKKELESHLGHEVKHFAYPYGGFSADTIALVRGAGFASAVSTLPGTSHTTGTIYTLRRVRDPYALP